MFVISKKILFPIIAVLVLAACSSNPDVKAQYPTGDQRSVTPGGQNDIYGKEQSVFGGGGIFSFGKDHGSDDSRGQGSLGVNSYLWRAALDTVSFMPLASADPFGGVILTDWYSSADAPDERIKLNVFILDRQLRSDGVQVKVFRQLRKGKGAEWKDSTVAPDLPRQLEDAILTRARQLRVAAMTKE